MRVGGEGTEVQLGRFSDGQSLLTRASHRAPQPPVRYALNVPPLCCDWSGREQHRWKDYFRKVAPCAGAARTGDATDRAACSIPIHPTSTPALRRCLRRGLRQRCACSRGRRSTRSTQHAESRREKASRAFGRLLARGSQESQFGVGSTQVENALLPLGLPREADRPNDTERRSSSRQSGCMLSGSKGGARHRHNQQLGPQENGAGLVFLCK